jgi:hypothetical protein
MENDRKCSSLFCAELLRIPMSLCTGQHYIRINLSILSTKREDSTSGDVDRIA